MEGKSFQPTIPNTGMMGAKKGIITGLRFQLEGPDVYTSGDTVTGKISHLIEFPTLTPIRRVELILCGFISIDITEHDWSSEYPRPSRPWGGNRNMKLFSRKQLIYANDGSETLPDGWYDAPFSLEFPHKSQDGQPLPQSSEIILDQKWKKPSHGRWDHDGNVRIKYQLEATIYGQHGNVIGTNSRPLQFSPYTANPSEINPNFCEQSHSTEISSPWFNPSFTPSLGSKIKYFFALDKSPVAAITVIARTPRRVITGAPLPLFLGIRWDRNKSTVTQQPDVFLKSITVKATRCLEIIDTNDVSMSAKGKPSRTLMNSIEWSAKWDAGEGPGIRIGDNTNLADSMPPNSLMFKGDHSFEFPGITQYYKGLKISDIAIECGKIRADWFFSAPKGDWHVLPAENPR